MRIGLNGWPLSPDAQRRVPGQGLDLAAHALLTILTELSHRTPEWEFCLIHPAGDLPPLPDGLARYAVAGGTSAWSRIHFEQHALPAALRTLGAQALWSTVPSAPLSSPVPALVPATLSGTPLGLSLADRLQHALARAGADGATLHHIADDLPLTQPGRGFVRTRPSVGSLFRPVASEEDSETLARLGVSTPFVLTHNPPPQELALLISAWAWVSAGVGEGFSFVLAGLNGYCLRLAAELSTQLGMSAQVRLLAQVPILDLPPLYRSASAFLGAGRAEGHELRHALACGLPIAAADSEVVSGVVGPAGYLVRRGDARLLGAACLAVLVQEDLAAGLRGQALTRAEAYHGPAPLADCLDLLQSLARDPNQRLPR